MIWGVHIAPSAHYAAPTLGDERELDKAEELFAKPLTKNTHNDQANSLSKEFYITHTHVHACI